MGNENHSGKVKIKSQVRQIRAAGGGWLRTAFSGAGERGVEEGEGGARGAGGGRGRASASPGLNSSRNIIGETEVSISVWRNINITKGDIR